MKELSYIVLKGTITNDSKEKSIQTNELGYRLLNTAVNYIRQQQHLYLYCTQVIYYKLNFWDKIWWGVAV